MSNRLEGEQFRTRLIDAYENHWFPPEQQCRLITSMAVQNHVMEEGYRRGFEVGFTALFQGKLPEVDTITKTLDGLSMRLPDAVEFTTAIAKKNNIVTGNLDTNTNLAKHLHSHTEGLEERYILAFLHRGQYTQIQDEQLWNHVLMPSYAKEKELLGYLQDVNKFNSTDVGTMIWEATGGKIKGMALATNQALVQPLLNGIIKIFDHIDKNILPFYLSAGVDLSVWSPPAFDSDRVVSETEARYNQINATNENHVWASYGAVEKNGAFKGTVRTNASKLVVSLRGRLALAKNHQAEGEYLEAWESLNSLEQKTSGKSLGDLEKDQATQLRKAMMVVRKAEMQAYGLSFKEHDLVVAKIINIYATKSKLPLENWAAIFKTVGQHLGESTGATRESRRVAILAAMNTLKSNSSRGMDTILEFANNSFVQQFADSYAINSLRLTNLQQHAPNYKDSASNNLYSEERNKYIQLKETAEANLLKVVTQLSRVK